MPVKSDLREGELCSDEVGILVSYGYGAGWSTWNTEVDPAQPDLVAAFEREASEEEIMALANKIYPDAYTGGLMDCEVVRVARGTQYRITEYDGFEGIEYNYDTDWNTAN